MTVALFTLGGTIAMSAPGRAGDLSGPGSVHDARRAGAKAEAGPGVVARLTGAELVAAMPGLAAIDVSLDVRDTLAVPSADLTFARMLDILSEASHAVRCGARGVVITQGTDTLEETAFLADLVWPHDEPLVLTGAMRNPTLAGPDGAANLLAAVMTARTDEARGLGVLVAFNDEVHAARWVRKTHSTSTATFASPNAGPIGQVVEGRVRVLARPPRRAPLPALSAAAPQWGIVVGDYDACFSRAKVGLYTAGLDDDGALLEGVTRVHRGLVVAGYGGGHVPAALAPVLGTIAEEIPVVFASRTGAGSALSRTYGAVGAEIDLQRRGLIGAGLLDPYKARVLLRMLLAGGADRAEVHRVFRLHG